MLTTGNTGRTGYTGEVREALPQIGRIKRIDADLIYEQSVLICFIRFIRVISGKAFPLLSPCTPFPLCSLWLIFCIYRFEVAFAGGVVEEQAVMGQNVQAQVRGQVGMRREQVANG